MRTKAVTRTVRDPDGKVVEMWATYATETSTVWDALETSDTYVAQAAGFPRGYTVTYTEGARDAQDR